MLKFLIRERSSGCRAVDLRGELAEAVLKGEFLFGEKSGRVQVRPDPFFRFGSFGWLEGPGDVFFA
jgi:hypothetical protein